MSANYKPCVDITFGSAAIIWRQGAVGGADRHGCRWPRRRAPAQAGRQYGGAQDEASCVIYGMPMAIVKANLADAVYSLDEIGKHLVEACV